MLISASILFKDRPSVCYWYTAALPSRLYSYYKVSYANTLYSQHRVRFCKKKIFAYSAIPLFRVLQTPIELTFGCVWQQKLPFLWLWYFNFLLRLLLHLQLHKSTIWKTLIKNLLYRYLSHIVNSSSPLKVHKFQKEFFILSDILSDGTVESSFNPMGPSQSMPRSSTWK